MRVCVGHVRNRKFLTRIAFHRIQALANSTINVDLSGMEISRRHRKLLEPDLSPF